MKGHKGKMVAPIVIAILMILYLCILLGVWFVADLSFLMKLACSVIPLLLIGVVIFVLVERIKEIRSGEEDDLSKY